MGHQDTRPLPHCNHGPGSGYSELSDSEHGSGWSEPNGLNMHLQGETLGRRDSCVCVCACVCGYMCACVGGWVCLGACVCRAHEHVCAGACVHVCACMCGCVCVGTCVCGGEKSGSQWVISTQRAFGSGLLPVAPQDSWVCSLNSSLRVSSFYIC